MTEKPQGPQENSVNADPEIEVRRSNRRTKTISAYRDGERIVVLIPARLTRVQEREWVEKMVARLARKERRRKPTDAALHARAEALAAQYFDQVVPPTSVRWATNQNTRWGSATTPDRTIRLSDRLQGMPPWVIDYVLLHELAHLRVPGHGPEFWTLLAGYPQLERARGFLDGVSYASRSAPGQVPEDVGDLGS